MGKGLTVYVNSSWTCMTLERPKDKGCLTEYVFSLWNDSWLVSLRSQDRDGNDKAHTWKLFIPVTIKLHTYNPNNEQDKETDKHIGFLNPHER